MGSAGAGTGGTLRAILLADDPLPDTLCPPSLGQQKYVAAAMRQSSAAAASASSEASVGAQRVADVWRAVEAAKRKQGEVERQTAQVGRALALLHSRSLRDRFSALTGRFSEVADGGPGPQATPEAAATPASVNARSSWAEGAGGGGTTPTSRLQPAGESPPRAAPAADLSAAFGTPVDKTNGRDDQATALPATVRSSEAEGSASCVTFAASPSPSSSFAPQFQSPEALLELELSLAEAAPGGSGQGGARRDGGSQFDLARRFELLVSSVERRLGELDASLGSCPEAPLLPPPLPDTAHVSEQQEQPGAAVAALPTPSTPGVLAPVGMAMAQAAAAAALAVPACCSAATQTDDGSGWDAGAAMLRAADCSSLGEAPVPLLAHICWLASILFPRVGACF